MFKKSPTKGPVPGSSKSKKSSNKEKERKKIIQQNLGPSTSSNMNNEKYVSNQINPDGTLSYVGFNPETIAIISEQFLNEELSDNVCEALAEDISYKMRELLSAASLSMRHAKRSYLKCEDVDSAFKRLNLEPIYGAGLPNWINFGDPNNYTCSFSKSVDLVDISQSETVIVEPGDMGLEYKWFKDVIPNNLATIDSTLKKYCDTIMKFSISKKDSVRNAVLKDVAKNTNIGPIIPALCNFCFLILQKNITYSSLAMPVLQLLEAIMFNPCTSFSAEEKQITLLIYLVLESIMNATNTMSYEVTSTCRTLGRMCICWSFGGKLVVDKIYKHLPPEPFRRLTTPVISVLTYIGNDALNYVLWPYIDEVFVNMKDLNESEALDMEYAILSAARLFYRQEICDKATHKRIFEEYGEKLIPFWNWRNSSIEDSTVQNQESSNWFQLKKSLLKTLKVNSQQDITNRTNQFKIMFKKAKPPIQRNIQILGFKSLPVKRKTFEPSVCSRDKTSDSVNIITGRRTLLTIKKQFLSENRINRSNGLMYTI